MAMLKPGDRAPDFSLPDQSNHLTGPANYRGHKVILWWYPKADTPG